MFFDKNMYTKPAKKQVVINDFQILVITIYMNLD